jgi:hypothetical protein
MRTARKSSGRWRARASACGCYVVCSLLLNSPAAKGDGVAVSVFGWAGVTGRSLYSALGRTAGDVELSLRGAELDLAAALGEYDSPRRRR